MFIKATELKKNIIDDDSTQKYFNKDNEESIINNEFMLFRSYWRKSIFAKRKDRKIQRNFKIASKNLKRANNIFEKENQKLEEENIRNGIQNDPIIMHHKIYQTIFCTLKSQNEINDIFGQIYYIQNYTNIYLYQNITSDIIIFYNWLNHDEFKNDDDNKKKLQQMINLLLNRYEFSIFYWFKNEKYVDLTDKNNIKELLKDFSRDKIYTQKKNETNAEFISYIRHNPIMFYASWNYTSAYRNLSKCETINSRQKINNVIRDITTLLHSLFTNKKINEMLAIENRIFNLLKSDHKNDVELSKMIISLTFICYIPFIHSWSFQTISMQKTNMDIILQDLLQCVLNLSDTEKNDIFTTMLSLVPDLIYDINKNLQDKFPSSNKPDHYNLSFNLRIYKKFYNPTRPIYHDSIYVPNDLQKLVDMDCHNLDKLAKLIPSSKFLYDIKTNTTYLQLDKELLRQHFILEKLYHKLSYNIFKYYVLKLRQHYFTANKDDLTQIKFETIKKVENEDARIFSMKQFETLHKDNKILISFDLIKTIYDQNGVTKSKEELNFSDQELKYKHIYQMLSTL